MLQCNVLIESIPQARMKTKLKKSKTVNWVDVHLLVNIWKCVKTFCTKVLLYSAWKRRRRNVKFMFSVHSFKFFSLWVWPLSSMHVHKILSVFEESFNVAMRFQLREYDLKTVITIFCCSDRILSFIFFAHGYLGILVRDKTSIM